MNDLYAQAPIWFIAALAAAVITLALSQGVFEMAVYAVFFIAVFYVFCVRKPG